MMTSGGLLAALAGFRWLIYTGAVLSVLIGVRVWQMHERKVGAAEVVQASKDQGKKANVVNRKVTARAGEPGAAERLLKDPASCRDCR